MERPPTRAGERILDERSADSRGLAIWQQLAKTERLDHRPLDRGDRVVDVGDGHVGRDDRPQRPRPCGKSDESEHGVGDNLRIARVADRRTQLLAELGAIAPYAATRCESSGWIILPMISVANAPGSTIATSTPSDRSSYDSVSAIASSANFDAA